MENTDILAEDLKKLDLSMISMKLRDPLEGKGWSEEYCSRVEREYRRFLALTRRYAGKPIVPSNIVDTFWHGHILDTQAYVQDCDRLFGHFLHHFPYFGMRGPGDAQALCDAYDETLSLYEAHWGRPDDDLWLRDGAARCPKCGRR